MFRDLYHVPSKRSIQSMVYRLRFELPDQGDIVPSLQKEKGIHPPYHVPFRDKKRVQVPENLLNNSCLALLLAVGDVDLT